LIPPRDVPRLVDAIREALARSWDERVLVAAAPASWDESAARLHDVLARACGAPPSASAPATSGRAVADVG